MSVDESYAFNLSYYYIFFCVPGSFKDLVRKIYIGFYRNWSIHMNDLSCFCLNTSRPPKSVKTVIRKS